MFTCVKGVRASGTFDSKREAKAWVESVESGELSSHRLHAAFDRYAVEESPKHKGERWERNRLTRFKRELPDMKLSELDATVISRWRDTRLQTVTEGSVRRDISLFKSVIKLAINEWHWLREDPFKGVRIPKSPPPRRRGISAVEISKILDEGRWIGVVETKTDEVMAAFLIGIETAMRASEILTCVVNLEKRVAYIEDSKNGDHRGVPLSTTAMNLFELVGSFTVSAETLSTLFRRIKNNAGISDLHFHDTRSEALTRLSKKFDILQLARIVGHRDPKSLMFYYAESAESMALLLD